MTAMNLTIGAIAVSVEQARQKYATWGRIAREHALTCPGENAPFDRTCFDLIWQCVEAASVGLDNAVANRIAGPRPAWVLPIWTFTDDEIMAQVAY